MTASAGGLVDFDIDCKYEFVQVQAEDTMNSLVQPRSWRRNMKDGKISILADLQQRIDNWRLVTYL